MNDVDHARVFAEAWAVPHHTRGERPPVDVNAVLAARYELSAPVAFSRTMLWDMEVRKAWRPDIYIPSTVAPGTAGTWNERARGDGVETFFRRTEQKLRLEPQPAYGLVLEQVRTEPALQMVTFIGTTKLPDETGSMLTATARQPIFHVEHQVTGTELQPLNEWRVVHLTKEPDQRLVVRLTQPENVAYLPEFIEVYIREVLKVDLRRK